MKKTHIMIFVIVVLALIATQLWILPAVAGLVAPRGGGSAVETH